MKKILLSLLSVAVFGGMMYAGDKDPAPSTPQVNPITTQSTFENSMIATTRWVGNHKVRSGALAVAAAILYFYGPRGFVNAYNGIHDWWCGCEKSVEECGEGVEQGTVQVN